MMSFVKRKEKEKEKKKEVEDDEHYREQGESNAKSG